MEKGATQSYKKRVGGESSPRFGRLDFLWRIVLHVKVGFSWSTSRPASLLYGKDTFCRCLEQGVGRYYATSSRATTLLSRLQLIAHNIRQIGIYSGCD